MHYLPRLTFLARQTSSCLRALPALKSRSFCESEQNIWEISGWARHSSSKPHSPQNIKKDRVDETGSAKHHGHGDKSSHNRISSTGDIGENMTKNVKSEKINPDDGSLEFKEKMSPGSTDIRKTGALSRKSPKSDVPKEVADSLEDDTVEFIKKQSGMSGGATS